MHVFLKCLILGLSVVVAACGCITGADAQQNKKGDTGIKKTDILATVKVGADFQSQMVAALKANKEFSSAYGLFSEGGWSNAGQIWVLANKDFSQTKTWKVAANKEIASETKSDAAGIVELKKQILSAGELKSIEENMFDGLIYEFTALTRAGDEIQLAKNVYIKSTDLGKHPAHQALVDAFSKM